MTPKLSGFGTETPKIDEYPLDRSFLAALIFEINSSP